MYGGLAHEKHNERPQVLPFCSRIILGSLVQPWMAGSDEFSDVTGQELHLVGCGPPDVDRHGVCCRQFDHVG